MEGNGLTNFFEKLEHHTKAQKALERAKVIEARKIKKGASYVQLDNKTWVLRQR